MPSLQEVLAEHVEELVALAQFSELGLFRRESGKKKAPYAAEGPAAAAAVLVDTYKAFGGAEWKGMVLRLVELHRQAQAEGDYASIWLRVAEMVQARWLEATVQPLAGQTFEPSHAASNAETMAADAERILATQHLGLRHDSVPYVSDYVQPLWWEAVRQSGDDPQKIAIFFVMGGGAS